MKICSTCKIEKLVSEFSVMRSNPDGLQPRCKACAAEYYEATKEKYREGRAAARKANRSSVKRFVDAVKSFPCQDCDTYWPPCAMQFDHRDPTEKVADISKLISWSIKRITEELMKCDVVCANCHAIRTHNC